MNSFPDEQNCQFFVLLVENIGALMISLIDCAKTECPLMLESFRKSLLPAHRAMAEFIGQTPPLERQQFQLRDAFVNPFQTLPSMHHHFYPQTSHRTGPSCWPSPNISLPADITPPATPVPHTGSCIHSPLGYTSTPFRSPPVARPQPEPFALINQLLTAIRTSKNNLSKVTEQFAHDPIFRARMLAELDELRSLVGAQPEPVLSGSNGQAISSLLDRVEQAEISITSLIRNLQQLEHLTPQFFDDRTGISQNQEETK
ncbi:AGAP006024-PA-like protein [Anopheles sinensis]|uniref:AGAP006024-PA-like protein n=1 Tax=Anopheles sinensis TaxID=74873 RepID=A0A084W0P6_ANOSI|nr:AGAP006024-PA-like protein [Anopheles sinensis]